MLEKITTEELAGVGVIGLPDTPRLSTEEMQRKFEETAREVIIPKFNALVDELSAEDAAGKVSAVSVNPQDLTEAQRSAARENIAALTWEADALDDAQKRQARANIGAIGAQEIGEMGGTVSYAAQQNLSEGQQTQARENIGAAATANLAGCWIEFTDENGNPTDEPYLHWEEGGDGKKPDTTFSELLAAVGSAVSVEPQGFTEAQKAQARANIGAAAVGAGGGTVGNAVLYDKQTLTDAQKTQARENINADKPEEWVELADITTTEEVNSIFIDKDKDGNPFVCRKIKAQMILPDALTSDSGVWFGASNGLWADPGFYTNQSIQSVKFHNYAITAYEGLFTEFEASFSASAHFGEMKCGNWYRIGNGYKGLLKGFYIRRVTDGSTYPVGTRLVVWGVKA